MMNSMNSESSRKIRCEVSNCRYHGEHDSCRADMIEVVCPCDGADCDKDTSCSTFAPNS